MSHHLKPPLHQWFWTPWPKVGNYHIVVGVYGSSNDAERVSNDLNRLGSVEVPDDDSDGSR
ncbi:MAG TPA: hypothetical protein VF944_10905 [Candidatus Bathyarchaeia archaeon]